MKYIWNSFNLINHLLMYFKFIAIIKNKFYNVYLYFFWISNVRNII